MDRFRGCRSRWCGARRGARKWLFGLGCILAGVLVLICFLPDWLFALALAAVLFWLGGALLGCGR